MSVKQKNLKGQGGLKQEHRSVTFRPFSKLLEMTDKPTSQHQPTNRRS